MLTPALSVLSAVEGLKVAAPALEAYVVPLAALILVGPFAVQSKGTSRVAAFFGPITLVWFIALASAGLSAHLSKPECVAGIQPSAWAIVPRQPRADRVFDFGCRVSGGYRCGGPLRRSWTLWKRTHSDGVVHGCPARAHTELSRPGRIVARKSGSHREPVFPALSRLGMATDGGVGYCRHCDCKPSCDYRRILAHISSDPAWIIAAP